MLTALRVLIVEDSDDDALLILKELRRGGFAVEHLQVDTAAAMSDALSEHPWDLIIADYSLPRFSGPEALALAIERKSDAPFILVSGVVGEETAVQSMKLGADDYVSKGNLARLVAVVEREVTKANERRSRSALEQQLRNRETHLAEALVLAHVGTWHLDVGTGIVEWSDGACRLVGFAPAQAAVEFKELMSRLCVEDQALLSNLLADPKAKRFGQDVRIFRADGAIQYIHIRGEIRRDSHFVALDAAGVIQDITERKRFEVELSDQRARFQTTLASIVDAVIVTDTNSSITYMNPAAARLTGWTERDAMRRPLADVFNIVNEHSSRPVRNPVTMAIRDGAIIGLANHTVLVARDGTECPIDDSAAPILDAQGVAIGVVLVFHDISARRKAEHQLEVSEVRYRRLFESTHDGILIFDAESARVLDVNRSLMDMLGYSREYFLDKQMWELGAQADFERYKVCSATLHAKSSVRHDDLPLRHANGTLIPVDVISNVYREGRRSLIQCSVRDISERRRIDEELKNAKRDAEASNRSKSEFLANMSHEIRTPMSAIIGFAEMLLSRTPEECARLQCVQTIRRNASHLLELINEILDLSKIEAGQMTVERIRVDLPALLSEIISLMRPRAEEKGLRFRVTFVGPIPSSITSDPTRLRQILVNLLGNAMKFTKAGSIELRVSGDGADGPNVALRIEVIDSGIGMTPELMERLFRPFTQGDESITRKFGGTGLGLTISRRLAKLLGGDIHVTSKAGSGSTFTLSLNAGPAGGEQLRGLTEATLPALVDHKVKAGIRLAGRILLVEDGRDNQTLLNMHLTDAGAEVVFAENGKIAVELATTQSFDLILMDMQMPVMDGYAATRELRQRGLTLPIIALTAYAMAEDRARCIECGCSDYLSKPIDEELLLRTIDHHLTGITGSGAIESSAVVSSEKTGSADGSIGTITSTYADNPRMMKIVPAFVAQLEGEVQKLIDHLERKEMSALQRVVHQLLGACGGYGFHQVSGPARKAEASIKAGSPFETIAVEIQALVDILRRIEGFGIAAQVPPAPQSEASEGSPKPGGT